MSSVITFRVEPEVAALVDSLAKRLGRSRASVVAQAIREYAEEQAAFLEFIAEGERDIEEGRFYTLEQMDEWFDQGIKRAEAAIAERNKAA